MKNLLISVAALICAGGASAQSATNPSWLHEAVFYQIYPQSFQDSDGDGIGDLKGAATRLDYIKSVGVSAIWFNPLFESPFEDAGYDITDFYKIAPRYGTNTDMVSFIDEAHKRGLRVCLDLVAGHTSDKSPWFVQSQQKDANQQYSDFYIWAPEIPDDEGKSGNMRKDKYVKTDAPRAPYYVKNYYDIQPALNFGFANPNPSRPWEQPTTAPGPQAVIRELKNIIAFWMDKGADGFRVDMANSLVKNDPGRKATIKVWQDITAWFAQRYPEGMLVSEWFNPKEAIAGGFNADFLPTAPLVRNRLDGETEPKVCYFDKEGKGKDELKKWHDSFTSHYSKLKGKGYISLYTSNHDSPRPACYTRTSPDQLKVLMAFFLTMPGLPVIYYGDEIGMKYITGLPDVEGSIGDRGYSRRTGSRTPMQWDATKNAGFSLADADKLYVRQDSDLNRPTVAAQEKDPSSLLHYTRALLKLRASSKALGNDGEWQLISDLAKPYPLIYLRTSGSERYIVALNPTAQKQEAEFPSLGAAKATQVVGEKKQATLKPGKETDKLQISPVSATVFILE